MTQKEGVRTGLARKGRLWLEKEMKQVVPLPEVRQQMAAAIVRYVRRYLKSGRTNWKGMRDGLRSSGSKAGICSWMRGQDDTVS